MSPNARQWNLVLALVGAAVVLGSVWAALYFVGNLAREERSKVEIWLEAQQALAALGDADDPDAGADCDLTLHARILESNTTIPLVLVSPYGDILGGRNFGSRRDEDTVFLRGVIAEQIAAGVAPILVDDTRLYFRESKLLRRLRYFPLAQLGLIATFVGIGYLALSASRRAEQNRVWVGMAKETAHQLGTPISAIMAWIEYLRAEYPDDPGLGEVAEELTQDVDRLRLVADRFNKIGSSPELVPADVADLLAGVYAYMKRRAPRRVDFVLAVAPSAADTRVAVNRELFDWVIENLLRNALDAMDGQGALRLAADRLGGTVEITVSDSGKGIPSSKHKAVFRPGYTTKARGWGLGLSLAKRIVEEYHGGRIFVKESAVGRGTTFAVRLPAAH